MYFEDISPEFSDRNRSIELIMEEALKKAIVADAYRRQLVDDKELKNFWGRVMGELLGKSTGKMRTDLIALDQSLNIEKSNGAQTYEFKNFKIKSSSTIPSSLAQAS